MREFEVVGKMIWEVAGRVSEAEKLHWNMWMAQRTRWVVLEEQRQWGYGYGNSDYLQLPRGAGSQ